MQAGAIHSDTSLARHMSDTGDGIFDGFQALVLDPSFLATGREFNDNGRIREPIDLPYLRVGCDQIWSHKWEDRIASQLAGSLANRTLARSPSFHLTPINFSDYSDPVDRESEVNGVSDRANTTSTLSGSTLSPLSPLSSLSREYFDSYPISLRPEDQDLVHYWFQHFGSMIGLDNSNIEQNFSPTTLVFFPAAMTSPWAFETTVLMFAAYHSAQRAGSRHAEMADRAVYHYRKAISLANAHLGSFVKDGKSGDEDMIALHSLAIAENMLGNRTQSKIHLQGLRRYMRQRRLKGILATSHRTDLIFQHYGFMTTDNCYLEAEYKSSVEAELRSDVEALRTWLDEARTWAFVQSSMPQSSHRKTVFLPGTPLHDTLSRCGKSLLHKCHQLYALILIHQTLLDCKVHPGASETTLRHLSLVAGNLKLEKTTEPIPTLIWAMLMDKKLYSPARTIFSVLRLAQPAKRLSLRSMSLISDALLSYLVFTRDPYGPLSFPVLDFEDFEWEFYAPESWRDAEQGKRILQPSNSRQTLRSY